MISVGFPEPFNLPEICDGIFREGGSLQKLFSLEHRSAQQEMAYACAQAFCSDSSLIFEAGTGVGKSLAYLVGGIIAAVEFGRPFVVSTHTIALQQQIIRRELPRIRELFAKTPSLQKYADFKCELLLGRGNYLCTNRLKRAIAEKTDLFGSKQSLEIERIARWAITTKTGLLEELNPPPDWEVWSWVNADSSSCSSKKCSDGTCFYQNARRRAAAADIIIVNHSLLFSMIASGAGTDADTKGVLLPGDMCVLDEAHRIPEVAGDNFGLSLSRSAVARELRRIYDPKTRRGLAARWKIADEFDRLAVARAIDAVDDFFGGIREEFLSSRDTVALSAPEWTEPLLSDPFDALAQTLDKLAMRAKTDDQSDELKDFKRRIISIKNAAEEAVFLANDKQVYWLEKPLSDPLGATIRSAPLDVAPILSEVLFSKGTSVILSSATLAVGEDNLQNFRDSVGAYGAECMVCPSPFDYRRNMRVLLFDDSPEPDKNSKKLECDWLAKNIASLCSAVKGGTLVLFTGYYELNKCAGLLREFECMQGRKILVQKDMPRDKLVQVFEESGNAVLMGTDSFWTGIDVPGDALRQVIITRLPFDNPGHPLLSARVDKCAAEGGNPFKQISIPAAVINFRQGIGRLIRKKSDKGLVCVLDSRILNKPYGKSFIDALPNKDFIRVDSDSAFDAAFEADQSLR